MSVQENTIMHIDTFEEIEPYIKSHRAINHPLFPYLKECAKEGFTPKQYQIYRDNYLFRTFYTIPSVALLTLSAALNLDMETLASAGKNLYEETGCGDYLKTHSALLQVSHNTHAKVVFGLEPISLKDATRSDLITSEARYFVQNEMKLYKNDEYGVVIGAGYAHETAANSMLINFYESFFACYKGYYTEEAFNNLVEYFQVHINGLEENHANDAKRAAKKTCSSQLGLNAVIQGAYSFLDGQAYLWDGLHVELKKAEKEGEKILVKKTHIQKEA